MTTPSEIGGVHIKYCGTAPANCGSTAEATAPKRAAN